MESKEIKGIYMIMLYETDLIDHFFNQTDNVQRKIIKLIFESYKAGYMQKDKDKNKENVMK